MSFVAHQEPHLWAEQHFSGAEMSDVRRTDRIVAIAEAMAATPGGSIPTLFAHPYDIKAAYNLFKHPEATPDNVQAGHRELVLSEMQTPGVYLLLEDTTELSFSGRKPVPGLGPIGNGAAGLQGFFVHSVLGARWSPPPAATQGSRRPRRGSPRAVRPAVLRAEASCPRHTTRILPVEKVSGAGIV